jgi:phosphopentomutase
MGVAVQKASPTYPHGLPSELLADVESTIGARVLCNRPHEGIAAIEEYGVEHLASGEPILHTSQDSVMQLAAHTSATPAEVLYATATERTTRASTGGCRRSTRPSLAGWPRRAPRT